MASSSQMSEGSARFISEEHEAAFQKFQRCKISIAYTLLLHTISHPIHTLLEHSNLHHLLALEIPFCADLVYEFFANLFITTDYQALQSRILGRDISITTTDLVSYLLITSTGESIHTIINNLKNYDWTHVNQLLRNTTGIYHESDVNTLTSSAKAIQHIVRSSLLPKAGDKSKITPLISLTTYFILAKIPFNICDLIFRHIETLNEIRDPRSRKIINLSYGHIITYILDQKYQISYPSPTTHTPKYFTDSSFNLYFSKRKSQKERGKEPIRSSSCREQGESSTRERGESSTSQWATKEDIIGLKEDLKSLKRTVRKSNKRIMKTFKEILSYLKGSSD